MKSAPNLEFLRFSRFYLPQKNRDINDWKVQIQLMIWHPKIAMTYPYVGFWIFLLVDIFMSWWHGYLRYMLLICCDVLLEISMLVDLRFIEDVTSISWILIIIACFIALIEVGRYSGNTIFEWSQHLITGHLTLFLACFTFIFNRC